ncbi:glutaminase domain-containing protein [Hoylesella oralis]|uniref:glutaminase family protein n=1 Tax=Hoylesella oralis TaxID=28134 RepID=UPI0028EDAD52|nr:DUF4965 domain-containing protein [Hoylesella oralis]
MKRIFMLAVACVLTMYIVAQTAEVFKPYKATNLRLPSVPLVVSDPYFSVWSPYDKLTDGTTRHWTNDEKPLDGLLRVDGVTYRFMGAEPEYILEPIAPMADETAWSASVTRKKPEMGWQTVNFDANGWKDEQGAFGSQEYPDVRTRWTEEHSDIYVRRTIELNNADADADLYLIYSHDDVFELYINGTKVVDTGETWKTGEILHLDGKLKGLLKSGRNLIAAHCHNTAGGAYLDFGVFKNVKKKGAEVKTAVQKSVDVLATNTYYTFKCGPVELDVVFTAPMLIDNLDLLSIPINYISYQVRSTDKKAHNVQFYLGASPLMAVNKANQPTVSTHESKDGIDFLKTGTIDQPILAKTGDGICIDWGYLYLPAVNGEVSLAPVQEMENSFVSSGKLAPSQKKIVSYKASQMPALAYVHDFGTMQTGASFAMLGYDEIYDIEYMYHRYKGYWARNGKTIFQAFNELKQGYERIMGECRALDKRIYDDGLAAGNAKYAEILSGSYRHVIAAHKLFRDNEGNLLFFSKENNSNGCVNTVDLTYPSAPLFLIYNPELQKGMMTSIFEYSRSGRWTKPFAAHDLGTYPRANGQVYGGDMPLEEAGNMLTLAAILTDLDGNVNYVSKYWDIMQTWADYLAENGQNPSNQLCTDDFAGHWAHNCNLSIKAIMGVAGFAKMARMKGDIATADKYMDKAKEMAAKWEQDAREGDHYRLAFDRTGTWSQKYNMVWDKLWATNIFPNDAMNREIKYYLGRQNKYGLPLDSRKDYTKSDWIMWTAAMSNDNKTFLKFVDPLYTYIEETPSRVPISDWHDTKTAKMIGFKARSVIGGYWMKVLADKLAKKR